MIPALSLVGALLEHQPCRRPCQPPLRHRRALGAGAAEFGHVFAQVGEAIETLKSGKSATMLHGLQGRASVQHVVESVMSAERSLQTVVAIRDKIVSAYQSISQMAI